VRSSKEIEITQLSGTKIGFSSEKEGGKRGDGREIQ
jgi:hypothetical protein